jgi:hypothetical protein
MTNFPGAPFLSYIPGLSPYTNPFMAMLASQKRSDQQQRGALAAQADAQREATARSASQQRENEMAINKPNQKQPDIAAIRLGEQSRRGASSTLLTGATGVDPNDLKLGRTSLLGG